jgi:hypothetical protein
VKFSEVLVFLENATYLPWPLLLLPLALPLKSPSLVTLVLLMILSAFPMPTLIALVTLLKTVLAISLHASSSACLKTSVVA